MTLMPEIHDALTRAVARRRVPEPVRWWRSVLVAAGTVVVTGTALAATTGHLPWQPDLGSSRPAGAPVPAAQRALLGVLRRPQTAADRGPLVRDGLRHLDRHAIDGVHVDAIRVVFRTHREIAILVPVERVGPPRWAQRDGLCLLSASWSRPQTLRVTQHGRRRIVRFGGGWQWGSACDGLRRVRTTGLEIGTTPDPDSALVSGERPRHLTLRRISLVPDGVTHVKVRLRAGRWLTAPVHDNIYTYIRHDPPAYLGTVWYDASGRRVPR